VVLPAILFLYGGVENSVGGWVASYVSRFGGDRALALGAIAPAAFYAALALGRLGTTWLVRAFADVTLLRAGWTCALLAIGAMLFLQDATQVIVAAFVAGLGCSVVYPITAATIAREVGPFAPRLVGPLLTTGGLGSGVIPWVVGQVSNRTGSLRAALFVAVLGGMVLLSLTFVRLSPRDAGRVAR
jgi:fucose permease